MKNLLSQVEMPGAYDLMAGLIEALQVYDKHSHGNARHSTVGQTKADPWVANIAQVVCRVQRMEYLDSRSQGLILCAWLHGFTSALYEDHSFEVLKFVGNYLDDLRGCSERSSRILQRAARVLYASGRRVGSADGLMEVLH